MSPRAAPALLALLVAGAVSGAAALAEGLDQRNVTFGGLAYEEEDAPLFAGQRWPSKVGPGWEYGLERAGAQHGWDLIPVAIDISAGRITLVYANGEEGVFPETAFNGYVLDFMTDCVLFNGAELDAANSTVTFEDNDIYTKGSALYIDVGGQSYGPDTIISILVDVADCPLS